MVPFALGPYVSPLWLAIASAIVPVAFAAAFFSMPESPYVLLARGETLNASKALQWLRGQSSDGVRKELRKMEVGDGRCKTGCISTCPTCANLAKYYQQG